ncbi:MAG: SDR family oxidoreductase [Gammaproteobacteria bacterium AqS3]|nr:SDR family oxidoreductase [Gammaproteobacteria bacterium AqS3]
MRDALDFQGRQVLVVGGSSGIGNGIAQAFRRAGAGVQVWGTRPQAADFAGVEGSDLDGLDYRCVDLSEPAALERTPIELDRLDVLVLSQGTVRYSRQEFQPEHFNHVVQVNLSSIQAVCTACFDRLKSAGGSVITVSSTAAYRATRGNPAYAASKAGLVGLTRTLGQAWAPEGIRVNGIAPGLVDTKLTKITTQHPERLARSLGGIPLGRIGLPEDMAGVALFLASPLAAYVIGQTILVDGGLTL